MVSLKIIKAARKGAKIIVADFARSSWSIGPQSGSTRNQEPVSPCSME